MNKQEREQLKRIAVVLVLLIMVMNPGLMLSGIGKIFLLYIAWWMGNTISKLLYGKSLREILNPSDDD